MVRDSFCFACMCASVLNPLKVAAKADISMKVGPQTQMVKVERELHLCAAWFEVVNRMDGFDLRRLTDPSHKSWCGWRRADRGSEVQVSAYTRVVFWSSVAVAVASGFKK